jgi:hypothetical protein
MKALDNLKQDHLAIERVLDIKQWEEKFRQPVKTV